MKTRCNTETSQAYEYYGGRGITVCKEWSDSYEVFRDWALEHDYADSLTIDRVDVNGNYEPSNCRWITQTKQCLNKRKRRDAESSVFIGVSWCGNAGQWRAQITRNRKPTHIGLFATELAAALAYDDAAFALDPEYVRLNFPERKRQRQDT